MCKGFFLFFNLRKIRRRSNANNVCPLLFGCSYLPYRCSAGVVPYCLRQKYAQKTGQRFHEQSGTERLYDEGGEEKNSLTKRAN